MRLRTSWFSVKIDPRVPLVLTILAAAAFAAIVANIGTGQMRIPPMDVVRTLFGNGPQEYDFVVNTLRLPRALLAFMVGTGLGVSGAILQGVTRNPLAAPDVIGISSGAGLGAVAVILLVPTAKWSAIPPAALAGALAAAALTYVLGWKRGSNPIRLVLVGIGIAAICTALINMVISVSKTTRVAETMIWLTGSVYGRSWEQVRPMAPWLAILIPLALVMARHLDALALGDDVARGLGSRVEWQRGLLLLIAVGLAGISVAAAGTVGFVGLMAPHIARQLVGPAHSGVLPAAGLLGGFLVVAADLLGRTLFAPIEIPCGVITAAIGAPYFIYLLYRTRNR
ncbi:MAG TPA: iron ABC transporter permease [Symbiobacteriaceae bacterium]|nr:iron ABC transporter permease [Symbiobacteriaceae bacterium]